ncbi:hypothetical protein HOY80DRAFT_610393 [Tuber brumale]|nr:hypothetical protein HOY80DRAFT_610393 [Tuber brumale]
MGTVFVWVRVQPALQASARSMPVKSHRLPPPLFNSLAQLGKDVQLHKGYLRLDHSLKRDFTSCLTSYRLVVLVSCSSFQILFLIFSLPLPFLSSFPFLPSIDFESLFFFCLICLILFGLVLCFLFWRPFFFIIIHG